MNHNKTVPHLEPISKEISFSRKKAPTTPPMPIIDTMAVRCIYSCPEISGYM